MEKSLSRLGGEILGSDNKLSICVVTEWTTDIQVWGQIDFLQYF